MSGLQGFGVLIQNSQEQLFWLKLPFSLRNSEKTSPEGFPPLRSKKLARIDCSCCPLLSGISPRHALIISVAISFKSRTQLTNFYGSIVFGSSFLSRKGPKHILTVFVVFASSGSLKHPNGSSALCFSGLSKTRLDGSSGPSVRGLHKSKV